jgi:transcriptional regulator with XRE-family HTH domain
MRTFFSELRRAREGKKMSLADIADATLINVKHLEAIEQGNTSILPQAYVRAFIREYASAVALDPAEVMRHFDEAIARVTAGEPQAAVQRPARTPAPGAAAAWEFHQLLTPRNAGIAAGVVIVVLAAILIANMVTPQAAPPLQEIPFQSVVKEHERRNAPPPAQILQRNAAPIDSLTLFATVTDTVWAAIAIDSLPPREYLFRPGNKASWRARDRFVLTLGNAGGIQFTLNKKPLGVFGRRGSVLHNLPITRQNLTAQ